VQVTQNPMSVRECEYVVDLGFQGAPEENALRALRNDAGTRGVNAILLVMETGTRVTRAEGYLCAD